MLVRRETLLPIKVAAVLAIFCLCAAAQAAPMSKYQVCVPLVDINIDSLMELGTIQFSQPIAVGAVTGSFEDTSNHQPGFQLAGSFSATGRLQLSAATAGGDGADLYLMQTGAYSYGMTFKGALFMRRNNVSSFSVAIVQPLAIPSEPCTGSTYVPPPIPPVSSDTFLMQCLWILSDGTGWATDDKKPAVPGRTFDDLKVGDVIKVRAARLCSEDGLLPGTTTVEAATIHIQSKDAMPGKDGAFNYRILGTTH
ncbi:hypothetical protein ACVIHD_006420 [Bradyrhizobium embrapense]